MPRQAAVEANGRGKALIQQGRRDEATAAFHAAVQQDPTLAEAHNNLGNMLNRQPPYTAAIAEYQAAITLMPAYFEAHFNLANTLRRAGQTAAAVVAFQAALALRPTMAEVHNRLGQALLDAGRETEALAAFRALLQQRPDHALGYNNLAVALRKTGQLREALAALDRAISLQPDYALAHGNRGMILRDLGDHEAALRALWQAILLNPQSPEMPGQFFTLMRDLGRVHAAIPLAEHLVVRAPDNAAAWQELAELRSTLGRVDDAAIAARQSLTLNPHRPETLNTFGNILRDQGRLPEALDAYRQALVVQPDAIGIRGNLVFSSQFASGIDAAALLAEARRWADLHEAPLAGTSLPHHGTLIADRVLRVGYVCSYFRLHSAAFFLLPVLAQHNPNRVEVFCYSGGRVTDDITRRFKALPVVWRDIAGLSDAELAARVRDDSIDVLVDITLHMQDSRLLTFARRPAPVQVTWLGYPGTTGLRGMDYRLTDPFLDPPGQNDDLYTEISIRLPHSFWCYAPVIETPDVTPLPALAAGHITFGCLNNFLKVTPETLALWSRVLAAMPTARLILLCPAGAHRAAVLAQFGAAAERVRLIDRLPLAAYFQLYQAIDCCLDTTPYPGHTTTLDGVWMGVPVVTLVGQTVVGRGGVSILSNLGLQDFITEAPAAFVARAQAVAAYLPALSALRQTLRARLQASPLMDAAQFAADMETAFATMWRRWCGRANPDDTPTAAAR